MNSVVPTSEMLSARAVVGSFYIFCYLSPYAMFGVVLARGRSWTIPFRAFALVVTFVAIQGGVFALTLWNWIPDHTALRVIGSTFLNALAWLLAPYVLRRLAPHLRSAAHSVQSAAQ
jgi:hypothetical protein